MTRDEVHAVAMLLGEAFNKCPGCNGTGFELLLYTHRHCAPCRGLGWAMGPKTYDHYMKVKNGQATLRCN